MIRARGRAGDWLLIPAFAVGRAQEVLFDLRELEEAGRIPRLAGLPRQPHGASRPPPSTRATSRSRTPRSPAHGGGRHAPLRPAALSRCRGPSTTPSASTRPRGPGIIVAGSGMATGGRILHHLRRLAARAQDHGALRRLPGRRHPRPAPARDGARELPHASARRCRCARPSWRATPTRRTPIAAEILRWLRGFRRPPRRHLSRPRRGPGRPRLCARRSERGWAGGWRSRAMASR